MFFFVKNFFFLLFLIELTPILDASEYQNSNILNYHFYFFLIFFFINFYSNQGINYNLNFDLIFKYFSLFLKNFSFLLNYFINTLKKIFLFLYFFKYRLIRKTITIFFKKYLLSFFLNWKPLFKKSSYFGYYRSNRSKWIK